MLERITWFRQSALLWADGERVVYMDPWGTPEDSPPADLIFITHAHNDHLQPREIERLRKSDTKLVAPHDVARELSGDVTPVAPGESHEVAGVKFETLPAYNTRPEALYFHPKANRWVGYLIDLGGVRYYDLGDTDDLPELAGVTADVAFVPIGGHYTMDPPAAGRLVRAMAPGIAVPVHFGFVVGSPSFGAQFRAEASPVNVEILTPTNPFERA
jgi:L-ascorbate metabolism protein UlaG (beta-lactamase superfamily)